MIETPHPDDDWEERLTLYEWILVILASAVCGLLFYVMNAIVLQIN